MKFPRGDEKLRCFLFMLVFLDLFDCFKMNYHGFLVGLSKLGFLLLLISSWHDKNFSAFIV